MGYNVYNLRNSSGPSLFDKLVCVASYVSMGFVGAIWIIATAILGKRQSQFVKYHAFQSIFISVILALANILFDIILPVINLIPIVNTLVNTVVFWVAQAPIVLGFSVIHFSLLTILFYLSVGSIMGKCLELPYISPIVRQMSY